MHLTCDSGGKCWLDEFLNCLWPPALIIRQRCCLCCPQINLTEQHRWHCHIIFIFSHENMIIYGFMYAWSPLADLIDLIHSHVLSCFDVCVTRSVNEGHLSNLSLSPAGEEWRPPQRSSCRTFVSFVPVEQTMNWGPPLLQLHTSPQHPLFNLADVASPRLGREMCVRVYPRMHDCVWVFLGWSKR